MNPDILTIYRRIIQTQVPLQEALLEYHFKISALLEVLLNSGLHSHSIDILHNFLLALSDMIGLAQNLNQELLNILLKATTLPDPPQGTPEDVTLH